MISRNDAGRTPGSLLCAILLVASAALPVHAEENPPAPSCALKQMDTDEPFDLHRFRGKVLYVDFWASWCGPCVKSFPFLNALDREFRGRGLEVVGINLDEHPQDAVTFLAGHPAGFRIAVDPDKSCPRDFGVQGMPTSYLVDRQGAIRFVHLGFRPGEADRLRSQVERLLNE